MSDVLRVVRGDRHWDGAAVQLFLYYRYRLRTALRSYCTRVISYLIRIRILQGYRRMRPWPCNIASLSKTVFCRQNYGRRFVAKMFHRENIMKGQRERLWLMCTVRLTT